MVESCASCGAVVEGGTDGCVALMHQLMAQAQADARYGRWYRLAFDAFCLQHPERHCVSAKSYAAHLMGLCHGLEHDQWADSYWLIPRWLNTPRALAKPDAVTKRGTITVLDVQGAPTPEEHGRLVQAWAENVWSAYRTQQTLARGWLAQALRTHKSGM
jgi:hypothetical protein